MAKRRLKRHTHRGMFRRMLSWKKPMTNEQKEERKKIQEADRERTKADLIKKQKVVKKVVEKKIVKKE